MIPLRKERLSAAFVLSFFLLFNFFLFFFKRAACLHHFHTQEQSQCLCSSSLQVWTEPGCELEQELHTSCRVESVLHSTGRPAAASDAHGTAVLLSSYVEFHHSSRIFLSGTVACPLLSQLTFFLVKKEL